MYAQASAYIEAGWKLCLLAPGQKRPITPDWSSRSNAIDEVGKLPSQLGGIGLLHAYSGTCTVDIDDAPSAKVLLAEAGIDLPALVAAPDAVVSWRGPGTRLKLWYRLESPRPSRRFNGPQGVALELRCATRSGTSQQDVLPPSLHPDGSQYQWAKGDWRHLPPLPEALSVFWGNEPVVADAGAMEKAVLSVHAAPSRDELIAALGAIQADGYEVWVKVAMALKAAGEEHFDLFHEWSRKSAAYISEEDCRDKWDRCDPHSIGPGTLFHMASETDPAWRPTFIETHERIEANPLAVAQKDPWEQACIPDGFKWIGSVLYARGGAKNDDGEEAWTKLLDFPVWVENVLVEAINGQPLYRMEMVVRREHGVHQRYSVDSKALSRDTEIALLDKGIYSAPKMVPLIKNYLIGAAALSAMQGKKQMVYSKYGWQEDGSFLIGYRLYSRTGVTQVSVSPALERAATTKDFPVIGTAKEWARSASFFLSDGLQAQGLALLMGFAAPLMALSGERGGVYSLIGKSGQGKSTIQEVIGTIYGAPRVLHSRADDTHNARFLQLAHLSSLPMQAEELTKLEPMELSALCYSVSEGRDKRRLHSDGAAKGEPPSWNTIVTASSNKGIIDVLMTINGEAESMRVLEDTVELPKGAVFTEAENAKRVCYSHAGSMGDAYMQIVVRRQDDIKAKIDALKEVMVRSLKITSKQRIRLNMLACAFVAGTVLMEEGFFSRPDILRAIKHGQMVMQASMESIGSGDVPATEILSDFINDHLRQINYLTERGSSVLQFQKPPGPVVGRIDSRLNTVSLSARALREYCVQRRADFGRLKSELMTQKVLMHKYKNTVMTAGMEGPNVQAQCLVLDWRMVQDLGGLDDLEKQYADMIPQEGLRRVG